MPCGQWPWILLTKLWPQEDLKQRRANIRLIKGRLLKLQSEIGAF